MQNIAGLGRETLPEEKKTLAKTNDDGSVTGTKDLKESQTYPEGFGKAIALCYTHWRRAPFHSITELDSHEPPLDMWEDAELEKLAKLCGVPHDRYPWS